VMIYAYSIVTSFIPFYTKRFAAQLMLCPVRSLVSFGAIADILANRTAVWSVSATNDTAMRFVHYFYFFFEMMARQIITD